MTDTDSSLNIPEAEFQDGETVSPAYDTDSATASAEYIPDAAPVKEKRGKGGLGIIAVLFVIFMLLLTGLSSIAYVSFTGDDDDGGESWSGTSTPLADDFMIFVDAPHSAEDMGMIYAISSLVVFDDVYHPMYILQDDGMLDDHELWNIEHSINRDVTKYIFSNHDPSGVEGQLSSIGASTEIVHFEFTLDAVNDALRGIAKAEEYYTGEIKVASSREALWVSGLAAVQDKIIVLGNKPTFKSQEEVWEAMADEGISARYVVAANPDDYLGDDVFYSMHQGTMASYHIPSLSAVAAEIAAFRQAYVVTDIDDLAAISARIPADYTALYPGGNTANNDFQDETDDMFRNNVIAFGYYEKLKHLHDSYGPTEYICLVGGAEALPQFEFHDYSNSENEGITSSDNAYGFLDAEQMDRMIVAVGRIVNYNVQGASNLIVRTFAYDLIEEMVESNYYTSGEVNWKRHTSSWNGFEVADLRGQNTPGYYFVEDSIDEGFESSWWSTLGAGAGWTDDGITGGGNIVEELEVSHLVAYRGHGSWHGSFYQWGYYAEGVFGMGDDDYSHLEGEHCRDIFLPPISSTVVSCENSKIHGLSYSGGDVDIDRAFATNWMYGGAIGLAAATEVSYSNIGQDGNSGTGAGTGQYEWDINDLWYAGYWDNTLNGMYSDGVHYEEETTGAEAVMYTENRYIEQLKTNFDGKYCTPFMAPQGEMIHPERGEIYGDESGMHWKEVAMFCYYGEPEFKHVVHEDGENSVNRWHNA